ncbi:MAG: glucosaminidase domain-containing protein [Rhodospirillaceae bacterium]|nr:glucosaminidase domain-containing protein [Rhodospirillales bacterium]
MAENNKPTSFAGVAAVLAAVLVLYALVAARVDSPLWRSLVRGEPVGLESSLSLEERDNAARLDQAFGRMGYGLDGVAKGKAVPSLFLTSVPGDLGDLPEVDVKKRVFLRLMLPLVLVVNQEIAEDRRRLEAMIAGRESRDDSWLAELAARYGADGAAPAQLLRRVDLVPPSLALAQAAEESGWGTSRFVREANNLFGHVGEDLTPMGDQDGPRMASFASLHEAVRAYVHNLNTHSAYETLRRYRATARARGAFPDGHTLAGALTSYSERGSAYVDTIRALIRANNLLRYDHAKLDRGVAS